MATHVDIVAQFDDRSVMVSANDLKRNLERSGGDAGDAWAAGFQRSAPKIQQAYERAYGGAAKAASSLRAEEAQLTRVRDDAAKSAQAVADAEQKVQNYRTNLPSLTHAIAGAEKELSDLRERHNETITRLTVRSEALTRAHINQRSALSDLGGSFRDVNRGFQDLDSGASAVTTVLSGMSSAIGQLGIGASRAGPAGIALLVVGLTDLAGIAAAASGALGLIPAAAGAAGAAIGTVALATSGFGDAIKAVGDPKKFAEALQQLSPNAQRAALSIQSLMPALTDLRKATSDAFFADIGPQLNQLANQFLPTIQSLTTGIAGAMNQAFSGIATQLMTPETQASIQQFSTSVVAAFKDLAPAMAPLTKAFGELAATGSSFLPALAQAATNAAQAFSTFVDQASKSGDLNKWINEGIQTVGQLVPLALDLGKAFISLAPIGEQVLPDIVSILHSIADLIPVLVGGVGGLGTGFSALNGVIHTVADALSIVDGGVKALTGDFSNMGIVVKSAADLGRQALESMLGPLQPIFKLLGIDPSTASGGDNAKAQLDAALQNARNPSLTGGGGGPFGSTPGLPSRSPTGVPWGQLSPADKWLRADEAGKPGSRGSVGPGMYRRRDGSIGYVAPPSTLPDINPSALPSANAGGPKLPAAPAVPYDTSLPTGFAGVPQTAAIVGAENSWMDARHTLAEKQARLDQLQKDNNATEADKIKARNDVINAEQGQNQAELRLYDARQTLYDKNNKQIQGYVTQMGQIGVALDKDLGLSKGLPGLADNLVRFIGSLAAAPLLGPLAAISQAQGGIDKTGSGLVGIAAAQGAFGQQYTPAGQAAAAAASGGGRGSSTSLPSPSLSGSFNTAADVAAGGSRVQALFALASSLEGTPYSQQLRNDCSGMMAQLVNAAVGLPPPAAGERFNTTNEAAALQARGFQPGLGGPGDFNIGFNPAPGNAGHTAATLPGGVNAEQGGSNNAFTLGPQAAGAGSPQFPIQMHLPMQGFDTGGAINPFGNPGWGFGGDKSVNIGSRAGEFGRLGSLGSGNFNPGIQIDTSRANTTYPGYSVGPHGVPYGGSRGRYTAQPTFSGKSLGADTVPAMLAPGEHVLTANDVKALGGQAGVYKFRSMLHMTTGGDPQDPHLPPPPPPPAPHLPSGNAPGPTPPVSSGQGAGPAPGPSPIGGKEQPAPPGGGVSGGGVVGAATGAAAMAADMFAPGSGAAVQIASQEIQRAIKFGGQAAGIGVGGLMQTFLPFGGSDLANNNWITRVSGAFAGVQPQIPNLAGKSASVDAMQQKGVQPMALPDPISSGRGSGPAPGPQITNHITLNNNGAANDPNSDHMAGLLNRQYENMPGQR